MTAYKQTTLAFIIALLITISAQAQNTFVTNEVRQFMSKGEQNGIEIILKGSSVNKAKEGLKSLAKKYKAKITSSKKSPETFIDNAAINTVSANTVDIYAIVTPVENGSKVTFFTDLGGAFITSAAYGTQYAGMDAVIKDFAQSQALSAVGDELKSEEKTLKTLEKELKSLKKNKEKTLKEIEKAKAKIATWESDIVRNTNDQAAKQQQISLQQQIIDTVKSKRSSLKN